MRLVHPERPAVLLVESYPVRHIVLTPDITLKPDWLNRLLKLRRKAATGLLLSWPDGEPAAWVPGATSRRRQREVSRRHEKTERPTR